MKIKKIKILALSFGITPMIIAPIMTQVISKTNNYTNSNIQETKSFFRFEGQRSGNRHYYIYINSSDFNVLKNDLRNDVIKSTNAYGEDFMYFITTKWKNSNKVLQKLKQMDDYYSFFATASSTQSHIITGQGFHSVEFAQLVMNSKINTSLTIDMNVNWELFANNYGITYFFGI